MEEICSLIKELKELTLVNLDWWSKQCRKRDQIIYNVKKGCSMLAIFLKKKEYS